MGTPNSIRSDEDQSATFVELFFDLVFVYAITQVVGLVHDDLTSGGVLRGLLVFWLIWLAWSQFTWALNPANTQHDGIRAATLLAMAIAFLMAYAVPDAFADGAGLRFVLPYVAVRLVGLGVYLWVAWADPEQRAAVGRLGLLSLVGLGIAVAGGAVDDPLRSLLWLAVIVADMIAAEIVGSVPGWKLYPGHFAERHGLIVIVALGESVIAVGVSASGQPWSMSLALVILLGVVVTGLLWWTYFSWIHRSLEHALATIEPERQGALARDAYGFAHYPLVFGIVAFAAGLEGAIGHPADAIDRAELGLLVGGALLFVAATTAAYWLAVRQVLAGRVAIGAVTGLVAWFAADVSAAWMLVILATGIAAIVAFEEVPALRGELTAG